MTNNLPRTPAGTVVCSAACPAENLETEIAGLRAELAAERTAFAAQQQVSQTFAEELGKTAAEARAAARQDAERVEAAFAERDSYMASNTKLVERIRQDAEDRAADIEAAEKRGYDCGVNDIIRQDAEEIAGARQALATCYATIEQDAEEKARLREALILARREISDHDSDYHHRTRESTIEAIRAALACRPQGEEVSMFGQLMAGEVSLKEKFKFHGRLYTVVSCRDEYGDVAATDECGKRHRFDPLAYVESPGGEE